MVMPPMHGMLLGMLTIIVPAFCVCAGIAFLAYRRRDPARGD
jgi:hypothetical protein